MGPRDRQMPKRLMMRAALTLVALVAGATPMRGAPDLFEVANGTYRAVTPTGWDGRRKLPLVLYIHGYGQSSADVTDDQALVEAVIGSGAVLIVPDGLDRRWAFARSPSQRARVEIPFLRARPTAPQRRLPIGEVRAVPTRLPIGGSLGCVPARHTTPG